MVGVTLLCFVGQLGFDSVVAGRIPGQDGIGRCLDIGHCRGMRVAAIVVPVPDSCQDTVAAEFEKGWKKDTVAAEFEKG